MSLIEQTENFVKESLRGAEAGHDWWHIYRVWQTARHIAAEEKANTLIVELAALLHDIADSKFHEGNEEKVPQIAGTFF